MCGATHGRATIMQYLVVLIASCVLYPSTALGDDVTTKVYGEMYFAGSASLESYLGDDPPYVVNPLPEDSGVPPEAADRLPLNSGIIDSGVNPRHPQLAGRIAEMVSFTDAGPEDTLGHGTAVAAGIMDGAQGLLYSARVTDTDERLDLDAVLSALDWMVERNVAVVNMSLGFDPREPRAAELCAKLLHFESRPDAPLFFVAAGNRGSAWLPVPAACGSALVVVVASDEPTSGRGDIVAPAPRWMGRAAYLVIDANRRIGVGDYPGALANGEEALRLDPDLAVAHQVVAVASFRLNRTPLALQHAAEAMAIDPSMTQAIYLHGLAAANLAQRETAIASLERLVALAPDYPGAAALLAFIRDESRSLPHALKDFFENN